MNLERKEQETPIRVQGRPLAVDLDGGATVRKEAAGRTAEDVEVGEEGTAGGG
jgi:hypothetical protein